VVLHTKRLLINWSDLLKEQPSLPKLMKRFEFYLKPKGKNPSCPTWIGYRKGVSILFEGIKINELHFIGIKR
jgi:hypothetical protein